MTAIPKFITVEGIDGSGKTQISNLITEYLNHKNHSTQLVQMNRKGILGQWIRGVISTTNAHAFSATTNVFLFLAAINETIEAEIIPSIKEGKIVVSDRFTLSTRVYQNACLFVDKLCSIVETAITPDVIFLLDVDPYVAINRIEKRGDVTDVFETKDTAVLNERRELYQKYAKDFGRDTYTIDANGTLDEVFSKIKQILDTYY